MIDEGTLKDKHIAAGARCNENPVRSIRRKKRYYDSTKLPERGISNDKELQTALHEKEYDTATENYLINYAMAMQQLKDIAVGIIVYEAEVRGRLSIRFSGCNQYISGIRT